MSPAPASYRRLDDAREAVAAVGLPITVGLFPMTAFQRTSVRLTNPRADAAPFRPAWNSPVHPYSAGMSDEVVLRNKTHLCEAAILTVITIVAHEKIVSGGNNSVEVGRPAIGCEHDDMLGFVEPFRCKA